MSHHILHLVERFLRESDMPPSVFGREAVRDPRLVSDLRSGREPGSKLCKRVMEYMAWWREQRAVGTVAIVGDQRTCAGRLQALAADAIRRPRSVEPVHHRQEEWA